MSTHKHIDKICLVAAILSLILCALFMNGEALGIQAASKELGYENRLFDPSKVHTIDIIMDDWEGFLETARSEEYAVCSVVIDGEAISNVGIRGKGNTSLSNVASMDSERYSFKIEFDQYDSTRTYHGLDKLSLNNIIQDNTYMKDYLSYRMMGAFDVPAPLCSYAYITVNGEDWGLYLAVEAVEEAFLQRNYGSSYGDLYKPDSMDMGGGRGNGKSFDMAAFAPPENTGESSGSMIAGNAQDGRWNRGNGETDRSADEAGAAVPGSGQQDFGQGGLSSDEEAAGNGFEGGGPGTSVPEMPDMGGGLGGMGSSGTKLQYVDDNPDSYSIIFESAKTDSTAADQARLIASLKQLSEYENPEEVLNIEDVLRYFVVHNYVVNGDSYTGSMIHNYYLYEENGQLSMIPWDYNLAFGAFQGGDASSAVNSDIDEVLSDRPMQAWIFSDEAYSRQYYALYGELLEQVDIQAIIDDAYRLIAPYVEKDPTAFCTYAEFRTGVEALKAFCTLRSESVRLQLSGSTETVDTGTLALFDMGTMGGFGGGKHSGTEGASGSEAALEQAAAQMPGGMQMPEGVFPGGMQRPGDAGMTESGTGSDPGSSAAAGNTQPNSFGDFGSFSPSGEAPDFGNGDGFMDRTGNGQGTAANASTVVLLAVSVSVLAVGLLFAFRFKR